MLTGHSGHSAVHSMLFCMCSPGTKIHLSH
ncbi:hypothetical protein LEMLEM_LOCUS7405, partial [Lemmus lemmus]